MDFSVLQPGIQKFINENIGADVSKLALQKSPFPETDWIAVLNQIAAKTKAKDKLPAWFAAKGILYPAKVSIEQASSEKTALHKAGIVSGNSLIDLTGGFGVDDLYFSKKIEKVIHCEINPELSEIAAHNFKILDSSSIQCISGDSTNILKSSGTVFDWIYIDPSRRNEAKGKVFLLRDCLPNVPDLLDLYFSHAKNILIKTAPILDISAGLSELKNVKAIHIVAVDNEVKELNWELSIGYNQIIQVNTVNILKDREEFFNFDLGSQVSSPVGMVQKHLYEPNSAIMKSGGFDEVAIRFGLQKLHQHSHLYTSDDVVDFPGRRFKVHSVLPYAKSEMKLALANKKINITTRNFPESVEAIRKKWKIKDGGNEYCFFTTDANNHKIALICTKI